MIEPGLLLDPARSSADRPAGRPSGRPVRHRVTPLHVLAAGAGAVALWTAARPIEDYDFFWHAKLGATIVAVRRIGDLPVSWLAVREPREWLTTQWLAEVGMHAVTAGSMAVVPAVKVLAMALLLAGLWASVVRGRPAAVAVPVFLLALAGTAGNLVDRPQTVSLVLLPWLAWACARLMSGSWQPPYVLVAVWFLLWAQLHGLWILGPAAFALVAVGRAVDARSVRDAAVGRAALCAVVAAAAGSLNPHGVRSFLLPFTFSDAASSISEWRPTTLGGNFTIFLAALVAVTVAAWARSGTRTPAVEIVWTLAWTLFSTQGYRNVAPAVLLLAPVACRAVSRAWGETASRLERRTGDRESRWLGRVAVALLAAALCAALARVPGIDPYEKVPARAMGAWVAAQPGPVRIFNTYNSASGLIATADGKARVVIDGRTDLWGAEYIQRVADVEECVPGWRDLLAGYDVDVLVVRKEAPVVSALSEDGWRVAVRDSSFVLLAPPGYASS